MELTSENENLYKIRHSFAHILAQAVLKIRPETKLGFGPAIDTGCYYDFSFSTPISENDFVAIEKECKRIIKENQIFEASSRSAEEAITYLDSLNENFKSEYCQELINRGETSIGFYKNGPFEDMCAGPHVKGTKEIPLDCFKIDSIAGAYWRGSEKNPQLTRIYCLVFETKEELETYIEKRKLAQERDHRKLGKELDLFMLNDDIGHGLPVWLPNGTVVRSELEKYACELEARLGYKRVVTPLLGSEELYRKSGHLAHYKDGMFPAIQIKDENNLYLKPMNCPHHHMIFKHKPRSYRELPLRLAEFGHVHRYEPSGSLTGLLRVRCFTQNDAHIYCTPEQLRKELIDTFHLCIKYLEMFKFESISIRVSIHDPANKEKFADNPEMWKFSEDLLVDVMKEIGRDYFVGFGEAAFYGPKIDFQAKTLTGREESIGTTQLDFSQGSSCDLNYIGEDGKEHRPYIVHRAPLGSHERFIAFLTEHLGGVFPTWLSPTQVVIVPVSPNFYDYAEKISAALNEDLVRVEVDYSNNSLNKKIRAAATSKIPHICIVGAKETENNTVSWKRYGKEGQETISFEGFKTEILKRIKEREMDCF